MIILGDLEIRHIGKFLLKTNCVSVRNLQKLRKYDTEDNVIFFYNYRYRKELQKLTKAKIYPNIIASNLCKSRCDQVKFLENFEGRLDRTILYDYRGSLNFENGKVYKVGNNHQGRDKYLGGVDKSQFFFGDTIVVEPFISGRSFRFLYIGNSLFVIEQKSETWLKNVDTTEEIVLQEFEVPHFEYMKKICSDILAEFEKLGAESITWGFDFVVNEETAYLLEFNDMCGMPECEKVDSAFVNLILEKGNI